MGRKNKRGGGGGRGPPQTPQKSQSLSGSTAGEQSSPLPQEQAKTDQAQEASSSPSSPSSSSSSSDLASSNPDSASEEIQKKMAEEERRKRIEAQVFAARIKQKRPPSVLTKNKQAQVQKTSERLQWFWDTLSTEKKRQFLQIGDQDLINYLMGMKNLSSEDCESLVETMEEALSYAEIGRNHQNRWEFWLCPHCDEILTDNTMQLKHIREVHGTRFRVRKADPVSNEWGHMIVNGTWKPVDIPQALTIIEGLKEDCSVDDLRNQIWPCSDDTERAALLERIRDMIMQLSRKGYFSASNLASVMTFATRELNHIIPAEDIVLKMAQTLSSICFLGVTHLNGIILFLEFLSGGCDAFELPDSDGSFRGAISKSMKIDIEEKITLSHIYENSDSRLLLLLDERFLMPEAAFMDWVFFHSNSLLEELEHWRRLKSHKHDLVAKYSETAERTGELLVSWSKTREEYSELENVLESLEIICDSEVEKRKKDAAAYVAESLESALKRRLEEIQECEDISPERKKLESEAIETILKDAQGLDASLFEAQLSSTSMRCWFDDLKSSDDSRQRDALVFLSLKLRMNQVFLEINRVDATIMRLYAAIKSVGKNFMGVSGLDHRTYLLPLLKSYLKENIEKLMNKEAEEKAAALIAELKLEEKKADDAAPASGVNRPQKKK